MVFKRHFGEDRSDSDNFPAKYQKVSNNYALNEASLQELAVKISSMLEINLRKVVKDEVESFYNLLRSSPRSSLTHLAESPTSRPLQLRFTRKLPATLYTNSTIHAEGQEPLQVALVDARSGTVVQTGALSSAKVEVLVLNADFTSAEKEDWDDGEFRGSVVREREGKRPLLVGDLVFQLADGVGWVDNVTFTDNSSWMRSRKFRLAVRVVSPGGGAGGGGLGGVSVREAVSEAFVVLDHRGEAYQKHRIPLLDDPVWRLKKISKTGASHRKLESRGIMTVKQFLMHYHTDPESLRRILGKGVPPRALETMVKHANECQLDNTQYSYYSAADGVLLVFNCVYKVIAVRFDGQQYQTVETLDCRQKAIVDRLKQHAVNQGELIQIPNSSPPVSSTVHQYIPPTVGASLEFDQGPSIIDQDKPAHQLDFNLSETASYPCTDKHRNHQTEDDSTAQSNQQIRPFFPPYFIDDSLSGPQEEPAYDWFQNLPVGPAAQFGHPQSPPLFYTDPYQLGCSSHFPDVNVRTSVSGKSRAGWCKIRAAVMWKIVRRTAANRRKQQKFPCHYC